VLLAEAARLDVGAGVALVDLEARVSPGDACAVDARAALLAREEGRASPEVIAFAVEVDGALVKLGGPRGAAVATVPRGARRVRVRAVVRGDRVVAVPLSLEPAPTPGPAPSSSTSTSSSTPPPPPPPPQTAARPVPFEVRATTPWSRFATSAQARWVDRGVPALVSPDLAQDHAPLGLSTSVARGEVSTLVIDAGAPIEPREGRGQERAATLRAGGAATLGVLLADDPLAIAGASDAKTLVARLRAHAQAALRASRDEDPLLAAVGQRAASAIARGYDGCRREPGSVPDAWPPAPAALVETGLLSDDESGCPRIDHVRRAEQAELGVAREGRAALVDALATRPSDLPVLSPLFPKQGPLAVPTAAHGRASRRRAGRGLLAALALLAATAAVVVTVLLLRRAPRETL
jgi:hypothetical protein